MLQQCLKEPQECFMVLIHIFCKMIKGKLMKHILYPQDLIIQALVLNTVT